MAGKKSGGFNKEGIEGLAKDKPVVYDIQNKKGDTVYTGVAKRGRVEQRLKSTYPELKIPFAVGSRLK